MPRSYLPWLGSNRVPSSGSSASSAIRPRRAMRDDYISVPTEDETTSASSGSNDSTIVAARPYEYSEPLYRIYLLSIVNFGISAAWALEMAITTPYFASALRSGPVLSHFVWVLGPISGLLVAPLVGYLSDRCTSPLGRRRPFVIAGAVGTFTGMLLFPNAREIASILYPTNPHKAALIIAVVSFALMDFSINTSMFPVRALQGDLVPEHQQHIVQSATMVIGSLGDLCISSILEQYKNPVMHVRQLFIIAGTVYACTSTVLLLVASEKRHRSSISVEDESIPMENRGISYSIRRALDNCIAYFRSIPSWLLYIGCFFALGFFSFFLILPNFSAWLGSSVLRGNPAAKPGTYHRNLYNRGVHLVGKAGIMRAGLAIVVAATYPKLLSIIGVRALLALAFGSYGVIVLLLAGTHSAFWGQFMVAMYSVPMVILLTVPMAITVKKSSRTNRGKHLGALNIFAVMPQLIDTTYSGYVSKVYGEGMVMRIGGLWSILAAIFAIFFVRE